MNKFFRVFDMAINLLMIACSVGFVGLAFVQVICRFVLNSSLTWSEELCRYLFVETVFLGSGVCILEKKHAAVDIVINILPKHMQKYYQAVLDGIVVVTGIMITYFGFKFAWGAAGQTSPALRIPYPYIYSGIVLGGAVLAIDGLRNLYTTLTRRITYHSYINPELNDESEVK